MADNLNCDVYKITSPIWERLTNDRKESFWTALRSWTEFVGNKDGRRGLIGVKRQENFVLGFYAQEDLRYALQSDGGGPPTRRLVPNFEKIFFSIVLDVGHLVLQRTRLYDYVAMTYPSMRDDFLNLLQQVLAQANINVQFVSIEKFFRRRDQSEMRTIFANYQTVEIDVSDLKSRKVPEEVTLSNPDPAEEELLKRIFNRDFEQIDEERVRGSTNSDLRRTKTAKAAVNSGHVRKLLIKTSTGETDEILTEQDEKITVVIDDSKEEITDIELRAFIDVYQRRIRPAELTVRNTDSAFSLGPLFDSESSNND